jgi:DNA-binding HxlR family transcriptional regulator
VTASKSPAVEYALTPMGKSFITPLAAICRWAYRHNKELIATVRLTPN